MLIRLRAYVKRETLISVRNFVLPISTRIFRIVNFAMSQSSTKAQASQSREKPAPFDPSEPSIPISYPIDTLDELESRSYFVSFHYPFNKASVLLQSGLGSKPSPVLPNRPRLLVCHDMAGGYLDDKWVQGGNNPEAYAIWHWYLIDIFVYFSHSLVTIPPPCWTNAAHKHGVKVLGTFITEWDEGRRICNTLLATKESAHLYAERLTELAVALGFDGWLINMEVELEKCQIPNMREFVCHLTHTMHSSMPGSLVIWYDSVTTDGHLDWQDQLNDKNKSFFDLCDGIFINYTWKEDYPKISASVAGIRKFDVYMGIDVFGRNTFGGGQWNINIALDVIKKEDVSAAIFAPGWVYETKQPPDFQTAQNRWWALVEKSWGTAQSYPTTVPFYSNFDQGHGYHLSVDGKQLSDAHWCNISCQSFQPFLELHEGPGPKMTHAHVNLNEPSYGGGGNMTFKGFVGGKDYFITRLFKAKLLIEHLPLHCIFSVKLGEDSLIGLSLELSSANDEQVSVFLAAQGDPLMTMNKFSRLFTKVILPHKVTELETDLGWFILEHIFSMEQYTLTRINVVCYKLKPEVDESNLNSSIEGKGDHNYSEYYSVLGHLSIDTLSLDSQFPSPMSWVVEGQSIRWVVGPHGSKHLSLKLQWTLKNGYDLAFDKYNVYVKKITKQEGGDGKETLQGVYEYLGVAKVESFYASDLFVPAGTRHLEFIIQICGVDGSSQKLDQSPSFLLDVEG